MRTVRPEILLYADMGYLPMVAALVKKIGVAEEVDRLCVLDRIRDFQKSLRGRWDDRESLASHRTMVSNWVRGLGRQDSAPCWGVE